MLYQVKKKFFSKTLIDNYYIDDARFFEISIIKIHPKLTKIIFINALHKHLYPENPPF